MAEVAPAVEAAAVESTTAEPESPAPVAVAAVTPRPEAVDAAKVPSVNEIATVPVMVDTAPDKEDVRTLPQGFKPVPKATPKPPELEFEVQGIIWDDASPLAVVNRTPVSVGDVVDGATVLDIKKTSVILETEGVKFSLRIHGIPEILAD